MAGDARHGRRDNGLIAAQYAAAGDVDPRVGEHLLDVLAVDGIAAYLRPSSDINPLTRTSTLPNRPTDRLYVDRAHLATARDYLARLAADAADDVVPTERRGEPEPAADTIRTTEDDLWAAIVAAYDTEPEERSWPAAEDVARTGEAENRRDRPAGPPTATAREPAAEPSTPTTGLASPSPSSRELSWTTDRDDPSLLDGLDTFGAELPDEEDTFVPPAPPPLPRPSLPTALGVAGIVGGLIVFLSPDILPVFQASVAMMLGFTAVVAGFGTLVWRLRPGDDDDEDTDPDNGARV